VGVQDFIALLFVVTVAGWAGRSVWRAVRRGRMCGSCAGGACGSKPFTDRSPAEYQVQPLVTLGFDRGHTEAKGDVATASR
jgi:hypothetical protein